MHLLRVSWICAIALSCVALPAQNRTKLLADLVGAADQLSSAAELAETVKTFADQLRRRDQVDSSAFAALSSDDSKKLKRLGEWAGSVRLELSTIDTEETLPSSGDMLEQVVALRDSVARLARLQSEYEEALIQKRMAADLLRRCELVRRALMALGDHIRPMVDSPPPNPEAWSLLANKWIEIESDLIPAQGHAAAAIKKMEGEMSAVLGGRLNDIASMQARHVAYGSRLKSRLVSALAQLDADYKEVQKVQAELVDREAALAKDRTKVARSADKARKASHDTSDCSKSVDAKMSQVHSLKNQLANNNTQYARLRFRSCPNGHSFDTCTHEDLKRAYSLERWAIGANRIDLEHALKAAASDLHDMRVKLASMKRRDGAAIKKLEDKYAEIAKRAAVISEDRYRTQEASERNVRRQNDIANAVGIFSSIPDGATADPRGPSAGPGQ